MSEGNSFHKLNPVLAVDAGETTHTHPVPVFLVGGGGSGGTSQADQSAFAAGSGIGTPILGWDATLGVGGEAVAVAVAAGTRQLQVAGSFSATPPSSATSNAVAQTAISNVAGSILAANGARKACAVQNTGTTTLKLGLGKTPTQTAYHIALPACGAGDDGSSSRWDGTISGVVWTGAVNAISSVAGGTAVVTELT